MHGCLRLMRLHMHAIPLLTHCTVMAVLADQAKPYPYCDPGPADPTISTMVTSVEPPSPLSCLRCPQPAEISRPRKVRKNTSVLAIGNKKRSHATASRSRHSPKSSSPYQQVQEFPGENFTVSAGKLFCCGCREELGLKVSVIRLHVKSRKHQAGKERRLQSEACERDIETSFAKYNQQEHTSGETLPEEMQVYRIRVVTASCTKLMDEINSCGI